MNDENLHAIDATSGAALWSQPVGFSLGSISDGRIPGAVVDGNMRLYVGSSDSDVDVGVLLERAPSSENRRAVLRTLITTLAEHVAADKLHLLVLNEATPALALQVLRHGRLIVSNDRVALHRFKVHIYRLHA